MTIITSKLFRILALLVIVGVLITQSGVIANMLGPKSAYAVGDLTVTWDGAGTDDTGPMFTISNMAPGDSEEKTITIENGSPDPKTASIKGIETEVTGDLSDVMGITISQNGTDLYGGTTGEKSLTEFFTDSAQENGIELDTLDSDETEEFDIRVSFLVEAGNQYQDQSLIFNLQIGIVVEVPEICSSIENLNVANPIYGTARSDYLRGTNGNDLIYGFEGSDYIQGRGGNDCIIGGTGSDYITGNNGRDILHGDEGSDYINGGNGADEIFGGSGSDALFGGSGRDRILGGTGRDVAFGRGGSDTCSAQLTLQCESSP